LVAEGFFDAFECGSPGQCLTGVTIVLALEEESQGVTMDRPPSLAFQGSEDVTYFGEGQAVCTQGHRNGGGLPLSDGRLPHVPLP
jgi:hypothetical protein